MKEKTKEATKTMKTLNNKALVYVGMLTLIPALGSGFGSAPAQATTRLECNEPSAGAPREVLLPDGTEIRVRLLVTVSSASAEERQPLLLEILEDVVVGGEIVVARAARAEGTVVRAQRRRGFGRRGKLALTVDRAQAVDGDMLPLGNQTSFRGDDRYSMAAVVTILTGPFGIFVKGQEVEIPAGTELSAYVRGDRLVRLPNSDCPTSAEANLDGQDVRTWM